MTDRAYLHIRAGLAKGQFRSGSQLFEVAIGREIGVGRTPVREALLLLANEGFVEQMPRCGTFVKRAGRQERQSLYELREVLESYAAGMAATFMGDAEIAKLGELCDEMRAAIRVIRDNDNVPTDEVLSQGAIADIAFHMLILKASGNPLVIKSVADMHLMGRIWGGDRGDPFHASLKDRAQSWQEHDRIYRAIRRRDAYEAANRMGAHLRQAKRMALEYYDQLCRTQGADAVGYEWPSAVRDAVTRLEEIDPNAIG